MMERVAVFERMRAEIRGSESYLVVGIDVAKDRHVAHFGTPRGKVAGPSRSYPNTQAGLAKLCERSRSLQAEHGLAEVVFGVEATGMYHKPWSERLIRDRESVVYVSAVAVKRNRECWMVGGTSTTGRMRRM